MLNVVACLEQAAEFDVVRNHTCFEGLATAGLFETPILTAPRDGFSGLNWEMSATTRRQHIILEV